MAAGERRGRNGVLSGQNQSLEAGERPPDALPCGRSGEQEAWNWQKRGRGCTSVRESTLREGPWLGGARTLLSGGGMQSGLHIRSTHCCSHGPAVHIRTGADIALGLCLVCESRTRMLGRVYQSGRAWAIVTSSPHLSGT